VLAHGHSRLCRRSSKAGRSTQDEPDPFKTLNGRNDATTWGDVAAAAGRMCCQPTNNLSIASWPLPTRLSSRACAYADLRRQNAKLRAGTGAATAAQLGAGSTFCAHKGRNPHHYGTLPIQHRNAGKSPRTSHGAELSFGPSPDSPIN
jgi:hypothetical protein